MATTEPPNKKPKCVGIKGLKNIQRILECPVCLSTPKNPDKIHLCSNEHMICDNCFPRVKNCPMCRSNYVHSKNTLLKQILSALPKLCTYADEGCNVEPRDDEMENHVKNCQFRPIECINKSCNDEISFKSLLEHLEAIHDADTEEYVDEGSTYVINIDKELFDQRDFDFWPPTLFKFDDQTFIFWVCKSEVQFYVQCFIYGTKEEGKNYFCKIKIKDESKPKYKLSFSGEVISVDTPKGERDIHFGTLSFSKTMAEALWNGTNISFQLKLEKV